MSRGSGRKHQLQQFKLRPRQSLLDKCNRIWNEGAKDRSSIIENEIQAFLKLANPKTDVIARELGTLFCLADLNIVAIACGEVARSYIVHPRDFNEQLPFDSRTVNALMVMLMLRKNEIALNNPIRISILSLAGSAIFYRLPTDDLLPFLKQSIEHGTVLIKQETERFLTEWGLYEQLDLLA